VSTGSGGRLIKAKEVGDGREACYEAEYESRTADQWLE
jgi:hypothetical protein